MTLTADQLAFPAPRPSTRRLLRDLERPRDIVAQLGPNWFASIMGTGIVANAAATLPLQFPGLRAAATVVWLAASILLVGLSAAWAAHWVLHPRTARGHASNPVMAQFFGAPPMALLTVGAGTLLLGGDLLGEQAAVGIDWVLWTLGTVSGLASAIVVPVLMITRFELAADSTFGGWLMPVVPPMVSAATGALLIPHVAAGQARLAMLLACYAMFGISLIASLVVTTMIWNRLVMYGTGAAATVPTMWIVLGWLGQSVTAAGLLGGVAASALPGTDASAMAEFGLVYGVPVLGFALLWIVIAAAVTVHTARRGLPFALTWWSFTFPVGTVVTGTAALAHHTGSIVLVALSGVLYVGLVAAWVTVAVRTARGSLRGTLFQAPAVAPSPQPAT
jgi:C4-dicarboxylate transporter/malic acid transport protein